MEREYMGYRISPMGTRSGYVIQAKGRGTIPNILHGEYTSVTTAKHQIDLSYAVMKKSGRKGKVNASETSTPSD